jgi:hypothetical protein
MACPPRIDSAKRHRAELEFGINGGRSHDILLFFQSHCFSNDDIGVLTPDKG